MAAIAAAPSRVPLLRDRRSRIIGASSRALGHGRGRGFVSAVVELGLACGARPRRAVPAAPQVLAMVAKLEQHLRDAAERSDGLVDARALVPGARAHDDAVLPTSTRIGSMADSVEALHRAWARLSACAPVAISRRKPRSSSSEALTWSRTIRKALLYGGFAAAIRGDRSTGAQALAGAEGSCIRRRKSMQMLDARIAELGPSGGTRRGECGAAPRSDCRASPAADGRSPGAQATVNITHCART